MKKGIGIYIGEKEVIAASVFLQRGNPQLGRFAIESIEPQTAAEETSPKKKESKETAASEPERVIQTIDRSLKKIGAHKARVVAAFNPFHLVTRYFEMPIIPHREWSDAVRYEASRYIPFKLSDVVTDYRIVDRENAQKGHVLLVTVTAAKTEVLRAYVNQLRSGSARVRMVEPIFSALSRAFSVGVNVEVEKPYGFIFIDAGGSVNITLARAGILYLSRDFLLSENRLTDQTRFYEELKASFDFMAQTSGDKHMPQIFLVGTGEINFWVDFLTGVFRETRFEYGLFPTKQDIPRNVMGALLVPIGLALRSLNYKSPLGDLSLLPPVERETKPERFKRIIGVEFLAIALFFIILRLLIFEPYAAHLVQQAAEQMRSLAAIAPDLVYQPLDALNTDREKLQSRVNQLQKFSKNKIPIGTKIRALTKLVPKSVWLEELSFQNVADDSRSKPGQPMYEKTLTLRGLCYLGNTEQEIQAINQWLNILNEDQDFSGDFQKITLEEVKRGKFQNQDVTQFRIVCR